MEKESCRVVETKQKIKDAFFKLYKEKEIEKITVKEIAQLAKINRGTFYVYYLDIFDLVEKLETETLQLLEANVKPVIETLIRGGDIVKVLPGQHFFVENKAALDFVFGEKSNPKLVKRMKEHVKMIASQRLLPEAGISCAVDVDTSYILEYIASAQFGLITFWYQNHFETPLSQLADLIWKINREGAITCLINKASSQEIQ